MEIVPGIHQLKVAMSNSPLAYLNCYLIKGREGWTMIDTGFSTPESFESLKAGLEGMGISFTDIGAILVTHIHPDHYGLAGKIRQLSPESRLIMHKWEGVLIESRYLKFVDLQKKIAAMLEKHGVPPIDVSEFKIASMPALEFVKINFPDYHLYGGENISTGKFNLEAIWTPGHSIGHLCFYEPKNQLLFSGDHLLPVTIPNVSYHVETGDNPLGDYLYSLEKIRNLSVSRVLPGHEDCFTDFKGRIDEIIRHHENRAKEILLILQKNPCNAFDISGELFWNSANAHWESIPVLEKRLAVMETIAHLEKMRWENIVQRLVKDDFVFYQVKN